MHVSRAARGWAVALAGGVIALASVACGGNDAPAPAATQPPAATQAPSPAAEATQAPAPTTAPTQAATAAPTQASTPAGGGSGDREAVVDNFTLPSLTIAAGTSVRFINRDSAPHTVTAENNAFDSGPLDTGGTFTHTFSTAGTFAYVCTLHPGMRGTITVQ